MDTPVLRKEYRVHVYETRPDGKVSLSALFNYMQDIASEHAVKLGFGRDDLLKKNYYWILSRIYAKIAQLPQWNDSIVIQTWPSGTDKLFAMRNYDVRFTDGRSIARASSSWLIIDRTTKKIQRPDVNLERYNTEFQVAEGSVRGAVKLPEAASDSNLCPDFRVNVNDLDVNLHTNNVNYLKWVNNTYDLNFIMNHLPSSVEINYLAESVFGDKITIRTSIEEEEDNINYIHSVIRVKDGRELCRVRLGWIKISTGNNNENYGR